MKQEWKFGEHAKLSGIARAGISLLAGPVSQSPVVRKADEFDIRVGGREINKGIPLNGPIYIFDAATAQNSS
ncbi:hypothetical protein LOZ80_11275 [Paenibacillus sp. HWE-109]|uniref:hypothetical protein n=1 Tax=Paenibacillus sp. HWE-109 TaxID=1306526 RepID=UPI001EE07C81|nr:hypothetical protein [Paenibacillus sp. HWE-109]UKS29473.1 hypothetical protein LOZ80_11275 [Paenibacillus sp. HWE-109]